MTPPEIPPDLSTIQTGTNNRILIVDDEESMCEVLKQLLTREGYYVDIATSSRVALELFQNQSFNLVIQDIKMPDIDGLSLIKKYKVINPSVIVIVITAFSTFQIAVEAMRLGAYDYLRKPFDDNEIFIATVRRALQSQQLLNIFKEQQDKKPVFRPFIGNNRQMQEIYQLIQQVAPTNSSVLVQGENGTGKELVARSLHYSSARLLQPFITVNCGAFPENLLESELFGHLKGSFTTALYDKKGLLEVADKGTFFLDEVSELSPAIQVKLLRVIEEREYRPVGSNETKKIDVRFIAATNTILEKKVSEGVFREDLFYRLNVITINLPPLRERRDDIPLLAGHFLAKYNRLFNKSITSFTPAVLELLINYDWPGNVRELENIIQRACILAKDTSIYPNDLTPRIRAEWSVKEPDEDFTSLLPEGINLENKIKTIEMDYIYQALKFTGGNITKAAQLLNIPVRTIHYKIQKYGIKKQK